MSGITDKDHSESATFTLDGSSGAENDRLDLLVGRPSHVQMHVFDPHAPLVTDNPQWRDPGGQVEVDPKDVRIGRSRFNRGARAAGRGVVHAAGGAASGATLMVGAAAVTAGVTKGAFVGALVGTAIPIPVLGTVVGAVGGAIVGAAVGLAASVAHRAGRRLWRSTTQQRLDKSMQILSDQGVKLTPKQQERLKKVPWDFWQNVLEVDKSKVKDPATRRQLRAELVLAMARAETDADVEEIVATRNNLIDLTAELETEGKLTEKQANALRCRPFNELRHGLRFDENRMPSVLGPATTKQDLKNMRKLVLLRAGKGQSMLDVKGQLLRSAFDQSSAKSKISTEHEQELVSSYDPSAPILKPPPKLPTYVTLRDDNIRQIVTSENDKEIQQVLKDQPINDQVMIDHIMAQYTLALSEDYTIDDYQYLRQISAMKAKLESASKNIPKNMPAPERFGALRKIATGAPKSGAEPAQDRVGRLWSSTVDRVTRLAPSKNTPDKKILRDVGNSLKFHIGRIISEQRSRDKIQGKGTGRTQQLQSSIEKVLAGIGNVKNPGSKLKQLSELLQKEMQIDRSKFGSQLEVQKHEKIITSRCTNIMLSFVRAATSEGDLEAAADHTLKELRQIDKDEQYDDDEKDLDVDEELHPSFDPYTMESSKLQMLRKQTKTDFLSPPKLYPLMSQAWRTGGDLDQARRDDAVVSGPVGKVLRLAGLRNRTMAEQRTSQNIIVKLHDQMNSMLSDQQIRKGLIKIGQANRAGDDMIRFAEALKGALSGKNRNKAEADAVKHLTVLAQHAATEPNLESAARKALAELSS